MPRLGDFWYADVNTPINPSVISATEATSIGDSFERLQNQVPIKVTSAAMRNETFPEPKQGDSVYRLDLGFEERYYETYSVKTNLAGKPSAGWYRINSGPVTLVNIDFQNALGTGTEFNNVFDSYYKFYEVKYSLQTTSASSLFFYLKNEATTITATNYRYSYVRASSAGLSAGNATTSGAFRITSPDTGTLHHGTILLSDVNSLEYNYPKFICRSYSSNATSGQQNMFFGGFYNSTTQNVNGFFINTGGVAFEGNIHVVGYN